MGRCYKEGLIGLKGKSYLANMQSSTWEEDIIHKVGIQGEIFTQLRG